MPTAHWIGSVETGTLGSGTESCSQKQGVGAPVHERDRGLHDLTSLSRQLLPSGSAVPAPDQ